ncbi:MAG: FeoB-associated Cys-rich membrane protein [Clostridia bacterium]|nr:FeoB-associated Cys-rich membrane protein [Clostridia bacterium]
MWPTILIASVVAVLFVLIIVNEVHKRKSGKGGCSCGGNCGACGADCHGSTQNKK